MNVKELIELLQTYSPDLPVCYAKYSEHCLLEAEGIGVQLLGEARPDGRVADIRPDKGTVKYLVLPGN